MSSTDSHVTLHAPTVYPDAKAFWEGARQGLLMIGRCRSCDQVHWYPRGHCPLCGSLEVGLRRAAGRGTIYSVSVTRRAGPIPFAIAYVTLDEGITMLSHIVDCDLDRVRIGDRVEVTFQPSESGEPVPVFRPTAHL